MVPSPPRAPGRSRPLPQPPLSASSSLPLSLARSPARSLARSHFFLLLLLPPLPRRRWAPASWPAALAGRLPLHSLPLPEPPAGARSPEPPRPLPSARTPGSAGPEQDRPPLPSSLARLLACSLSPEQQENAARLEAAPAGQPPAHPRCVRDSGRLRARLGPQRQLGPPRPGLWASRAASLRRRLSAPPGQAGAQPTPRRGSDLAGAR